MPRTLLIAIAAGLAALPAVAQETQCLAYRVTIEDFARRGIDADRGLASIVEVLERRMDEQGASPPTATLLGDDIVVVRVPAKLDPAKLRDDLARPGEFSIHVVERTFPTSELPVMLIGPDRIVASSVEVPEVSYLLHAASVLDGGVVVEARGTFDSSTGEPIVSFTLDERGRSAFAKATRANVLAQFAVVLDGIVLTAPVIREPITSGRGQIAGGFTPELANELALLLRSGALPARLVLLGEGAAACIP